MKIQVYPQRYAEGLNFDEKHAFISVTSIEFGKANLKINDSTVGVLRLRFDDAISQDSWVKHGYRDLYKRDVEVFTKEMAQEVVKFVEEVKEKIEVLVIHCNHGRSRSCGIAWSICQRLGIDGTEFTVRPRNPNSRVMKIIGEVYAESSFCRY